MIFMNTSMLMLVIILSVFLSGCSLDPQGPGGASELTPLSVIADAFKNQQSDLQVLQEGVIIAVLSDDLEGDRHQRMIVRLGNDQTLLIAHNIDLAPRVPDPKVGKTLRFYGEYEWNDQGGVIHWTHGDPGSKHIAGWLEYEGKRYGGDGTAVTSKSLTDRKWDNRYHKVVSRGSARYLSGVPAAVFDLRGRSIVLASVQRGAGISVMHRTVPDGMNLFLHF
jgi:hypothetical protein